MKHVKVVLLCFFAVLALQCNNNSESDKIREQYFQNNSDIIGKTLQFSPDSLVSYNRNFSGHPKEGNPKIIMVVGSECAPCITKFQEWEAFLNKRQLQLIDIIFIAVGGDSEYLDYHVNKKNKFDFFIFLDNNRGFLNENQLNAYQNTTFLLDGKNKVVLVGDPSKSETVLKYYNDEIEKLD